MGTTLARYSLLLAILASGSLVLAHGGTYQGPSGGGTPQYGGPAGGGTHGPHPGNPDPGSPNGGTTPGLGGGTTGGAGDPRGPVRPGRTGPTGGSRVTGRGGTTPRRAKVQSSGNESWRWWWDLNEERFLNLKMKVRGATIASTNRDIFLGADVVPDVAEMTGRLRMDIIPTLKLGLKDEWYDARAGALIALGKVGDAAQPDLRTSIEELLSDIHDPVRESACLALGILGDAAAIPLLFEIFDNDPKARRLLGREQGDILNRTRTFAAVAIGLIGSRGGFENQGIITRLLEGVTAPGATRDLQLGPALALGLLRSQDAVPGMLKILADEDVDAYARAHLAVSLAKIGAKVAIPDLVRLLGHKNTHLARSACIGLGLLASSEDTAVANRLIRQARSGKDRALRNFALIALGEQAHPKGLAWLETTLRGARNEHDQAFAALALGVAAFHHDASGPAVGGLMLAEYRRQRSDARKAPLAIALGLTGYEPASETLRRDLDRRGSQELKGHVCTALGLLLDETALAPIRKLVRQKGDGDLRKRAAIALGLMRDSSAVGLLEEVIAESGNSKAILGAATVALGYVGDRRAVSILRAMVENTQHTWQRSTRAFATVALGFLGDKDDIPILSRLQESSNYLADSATLVELFSIL